MFLSLLEPGGFPGTADRGATRAQDPAWFAMGGVSAAPHAAAPLLGLPRGWAEQPGSTGAASSRQCFCAASSLQIHHHASSLVFESGNSSIRSA